MNSITSVIDGDTIVYLVAYNLREVHDVDDAIPLVDSFINLILRNTNCSKYIGFIGGTKCFRHGLTETYKAKRPDKPDWFERWEPIIRFRLREHWMFYVSDGIEAEDAAIITANKIKHETNVVLCHVDKDLNFWEGNHYNFQKHHHWYTDNLGSLEEPKKGKIKGTGRRFQYAQMIMGDPTDGITGIKGKGAVFAYNLLKDKKTEFSLFRATYTAYKQYVGKDYKEQFILNRQLVCMLEVESYGFEVPPLIERD